eukprot:6204847-Pleurochrysis_carterae.AAC.1
MHAKCRPNGDALHEEGQRAMHAKRKPIEDACKKTPNRRCMQSVGQTARHKKRKAKGRCMQRESPWTTHAKCRPNGDA